MRVGPHPAVGRLRKRAQFVAAARGRRHHNGLMTVQCLARPEGDVGLRLGFTITKKVGHATERNRIRRRLRAASAEASAMSPDAAFDLVVIGRREALGAPYSALVQDLSRAIGVLTKPRTDLASERRRSPGPAKSHG